MNLSIEPQERQLFSIHEELGHAKAETIRIFLLNNRNIKKTRGEINDIINLASPVYRMHREIKILITLAWNFQAHSNAYTLI